MRSSLARPKREAEDYARTHHAEYDLDGPSSSKKPRFDVRNPSALAPDALENDATLDADEIGHRGQRVRRNAVNVDGYDSDSENEGFDARAEAKAKASKEKDGDNKFNDDDMFAELEEEFAEPDKEDDEVKVKKKQVRFLADNEIEGQVGDSRSGGKVDIGSLPSGKGKQREQDSDDQSDSDGDEAVRAALDETIDEEVGAGGKKSHVPLLDAFNMRAEQEEGAFDEAGNFVRKAVDPDSIHDSWLEGVSKKDMRKAREAAEKREEERLQKSLADDRILTSDILKTLITHMEKGETILESLARLGKGLKHRPKWQNKNKNRHKKTNGAAEDIEMDEEDPLETARKRGVEEITEAADILLSRGQAEIYDAERELLIRQYRQETGDDWIEPTKSQPNEEMNQNDTDSNMWEFRWLDARDNGEVHGPYEKAMMESWYNAGYFTGGIEFRKGNTDQWSLTPGFLS